MSRSVRLTVPDRMYTALARQAAASGCRAEELIMAWLTQRVHESRIGLSPRELKRRKKRFEMHFGAWNSGDPKSCDNERIDRDLAKEYARGLGRKR